MNAIASKLVPTKRPLLAWVLTGIVVVGLAIDAYTHLDLAPLYAGNKTSTISQETLFRIEATLAILIALAAILRSNRWTALLVVAIAGGGAAVLLIYRYVQVGQIGPLPDMSEPLWYHEKSWSLVGEIIALVGGVGLVVLPNRASRHRSDA